MEHQETTTPAGVRVITEPMPSMRSVTLGLWFTVGSRDERPDQWGCSHFLEHLLFKGTTNRTTLQIAEELDAIGGEANAFTAKETTCFYARVLDDQLEVAVDVLGDMVRSATNTPADVEAERDVVLEEIHIHLDSPEDLAHSDVGELVLGEHPLARETLGSLDSIESMSRETIHRYYLDHYRPESLVVVAAGNVDHDHLTALVDKHLGDLGRPGRSPATRAPAGAASTGRIHVRHRPTEQAHVAVAAPGVAVTDPRRHALSVATTIVGGGMSSWLFQEIREVRGLAYSTYAFMSGFTDTGFVGAYVGTTPAKVDEASRVLVAELARLASDCTEEEVERAKASMLGGLVLALEDTGSRMSRLGRLAVTGQELTTIDEVIDRIAGVTTDEVRAVAAETYGAPRSVAVVGPFDAGDTDRFARYTG